MSYTSTKQVRVASDAIAFATALPVGSTIFDVATGNSYTLIVASIIGETLAQMIIAVKTIEISSTEIGGVAWVAGTTYAIGDITTEATEVYISLQAGNTGNLVSDPAWWKDISTSGVFVNTFTPTLGTLAGEYPVTTGQAENDYWIIGGVTGTYLMITGDLLGQNVKDNDRFVWDGTGVTGDGTGWSLIPGAAAIAESGGRLFATTVTYAIGDIVTNAGVIYRCISVPAVNPGAFVPTDWVTVDQKSMIIHEEVAIAAQTAITLPNTVDAKARVFINGSLLLQSSYTFATTIITLDTALLAADEIVVENFAIV